MDLKYGDRPRGNILSAFFAPRRSARSLLAVSAEMLLLPPNALSPSRSPPRVSLSLSLTICVSIYPPPGAKGYFAGFRLAGRSTQTRDTRNMD